MPNDLDSTISQDQFEKENSEFDEVFNDIIDKTDEELKAEATKKPADSDEAGEATKDQSTEVDDEAKAAEARIEAEAKGHKVEPTPDATVATDTTDWKLKCDELEAELKKERQRTSSWDGRIKAANKKAKELEAENASLKEQLAKVQESSNDTEDQTDQEVMDKFKETFPELIEFADVMQRKIDKRLPNTPVKVDPEPEDNGDQDATDNQSTTVDTGQSEKQKQAAANEHHRLTRKAHPDLDEAVSTGVLLTWINQQPDYIKDHLGEVYYGENGKGSAQQVIDMVTNFKSKTGWKSQLPTGNKAKEDKLQSMVANEGESTGPVDKTEKDKNDFAGAAKEAGL
jgi:hypothetical protein